MPHLAVARELEHVAMADQVRLDVGARVFEAVADAGLGAQVDDAGDVERICERFERIGVREIEALEAVAVAELLLQSRKPRLLQLGVVIIVETVDSDDLVAALEQRARRCSADEPRSSRD